MKVQTITRAKLEQFVKTRNESLHALHDTNLQFQIDLDSCGLTVASLGECDKRPYGYMWTTPFGRIIEVMGKLWLEGDDLFDSALHVVENGPHQKR